MWSKKHEWVRRAEAWDAHTEALHREAFDDRLRQLARSQADFAVEEFERLVQRVRKADRILDKADSLPLTDVELIEEGEGGKRKHKRIRGVDLARYAALMKEIRESARRAILGPRDADERTPDAGAGDFVVSGPDERKAA